MGATTPLGDVPPVVVPPAHWDRLFAPSSCLATITTVDRSGRVNAASFGTCTRVRHDPVTLAFTVGAGKDTYENVLSTGEFVVNLPAWDRRQLEQVRVTGLDFAPGVDELERAGLRALPALVVGPPRIADFGRHFECVVEWTRQWEDRLMVVGRVVGASCAPGLVDDDGYLVWEAARPAHYCGWPYENAFVAAYDVLRVDLPYEGPEASAGERAVPPYVRGSVVDRCAADGSC
ncbi:MAG TPA: flavin reductase family protein [Acidimicrobiales bacterium]|nr:flavin reductase family protein [Acidimicrobiales bacterium]